MRYKRFMIIVLAVFALSVAGVCASDVDDAVTSIEEASPLESSADDSIIEVVDVQAIGENGNDELIGDGNEGTFSQLQVNIGRNHGSTLKLDKDYACEDGFSTDGINITDSITIDGQGHTIDANGKARIFNIKSNNVILKNIILKNGNTTGDGGAIFFDKAVTGTVINCTFTNNTAIGGGAMSRGSAINSTFNDNTASDAGGAMCYSHALNCIFNGNTVSYAGGAMFMGSAVNCTFNNNAASQFGGAMFEGAAVNCLFNGNTASEGDAMFICCYINCSGQEDQHYDSSVLSPKFDMEDFISTYHSNGLKINLISSDGWRFVVCFIDVDVIIYNGEVEIMRCSCLSGDSLNLDLAAGNYTAQLIVTYPGLTAVSKNISLTINKATTKIEVTSAITVTYNTNNYLVITLTDSNGNRLASEKITVTLNGEKTYTTDKNGQVKVSTKGLAPKEYTAKIGFNGNANYTGSTKDVKVTVKKAKPKITAKAKSFKKSLKIKKYAVTLKAGKNPVKKVKVTIKIGKKTYTAKTNSKGKATFKIKKLSKKGTYKSKVTFKGNKYYNKVTKTVKIKIK